MVFPTLPMSGTSIAVLALRFSLISESIPKTYRYLVLRLSLNHIKNQSVGPVQRKGTAIVVYRFQAIQ